MLFLMLFMKFIIMYLGFAFYRIGKCLAALTASSKIPLTYLRIPICFFNADLRYLKDLYQK